MDQAKSSSYPSKSIAVLPFVNMSPDPENEYFSDGITEEIINALTGVVGLKVIARTSSFAFKGKNIDVRTIGSQLGVQSILEGSVRKSKNRVRITAQLIDTKTGLHLWSKNFDRELDDIFATQDEISLLIADQVRENFGHFDIKDKLFESHTQNVTAYNTFLKGRFHQLKWNNDSYHLAIKFYKEAILLDPRYPMPHIGLVQCYTYLFLWRAISKSEAREKTDFHLNAIKNIHPNLAEYHLAQSSRSIILDWDLKKAHQELNKTLELSPANTDALEALAGLYIVIGQFDAGIKSIDKALEVNPLSANHSFMKGNLLYYKKDYNEAIKWMDIALKLEPNMLLAQQVKMATLLQSEKQNDLTNLIKKNQQHPFAKNFETLQNLMAGKSDISVPEGDFENEFLPWELYFSIYKDESDLAFLLLKNGLKNQIGQYFCFRHDPFLKPLKKDSRFQIIEKSYPDFSLQLHETKEIQAPTEIPKMESSEIEEYLLELARLMEGEKCYLDPTLSLKSLSEKIDLHSNKLSWLINEQLGKNFNEYINSFRLESFKSKALDEKNSHLTLLGLAYESGFNSKTVFNAFFKKTEGKTPREWMGRN
ncbi:MAG: helix-turn-helix domain-containing protein [Saprospiraceae bacterium]